MTRALGALTAAFVSVLFATACGATDAGQNPAPQQSASASASPNQKLDASLAAKLPQLPADQTVRLVATLEPGVPTDQIRDQLTRLDGRLIGRFTIIEAIVVDIPARNVLALAALPQIKGLELEDTGVAPPSTR